MSEPTKISCPECGYPQHKLTDSDGINYLACVNIECMESRKKFTVDWKCQ